MRAYAAFAARNKRLLAFGALMTFSSSFGQTFFISLFAGEIRAEFSLSDGEFGLIYSVGTLLSAAALLATGPLIDRIDLRACACMVLFGLAAACTALSFSESAILLIGIVFLLRQFGQALPGHTAMTAMGRYFDDGRGKAVSQIGRASCRERV